VAVSDVLSPALSSAELVALGPIRQTEASAREDFSAQVRHCLLGLERLLEDTRQNVSALVWVMVLLAEEKMTPQAYAAYNDAYNRFFVERGIGKKPARTTVGVVFDEPGVVVEMEAIALAADDRL